MAKADSQVHGSITEISTSTPGSTERDPFNTAEPFQDAHYEKSRETERWHVSFATQFWIVFLLLLGVGFSLAHHFYYTSLDGEPTADTSQEWAIRIGTGLSVLAKACLIASAAMSYQQHYWTTLRARAISVRGIDDIMGLLGNPAGFFNWEVLRHAPLSALIALTIWCMPLSALAPPASLSAALSVTEVTNVSNVPMVMWNGVQFAVTGGRGEFADAGQTTYRTVTGSAYSGSILPMPALGGYKNYTYTISFPGPRLRCGDVQNQTLFDAINLNGRNTWRNNSLLYDIAYNATDRGVGMEMYRSNIPPEKAYDIFFLTPDRNFTCEMWNATYTARFTFTNGEQTIDVTNVNYESHFEPKLPDGFALCPYDTCAYKGWFRAIAGMLRGEAYTGGAYNTFSSTTRVLQTSLIGCSELRLAANMSGIAGVTCPAANLEKSVEMLSENATLSFFGALPSVYWPEKGIDGFRVDPTDSSLYITASNQTTVAAETTISETRLVHSYNKRALLISYSAAIFVALIILLIGFRALWHNGITHENTFSGILCTTRNPDLDHWAQGHCLGLKHSLQEISKQKLQFGILVDRDGREVTSGGVRHAAFGYADKVVELKKGDKCI